MPYQISTGVIALGLLLPLGQTALADQPTPSKQSIIDALSAPAGSASRGFVHAPAGATPKPAAPATYHAPGPSEGAADHASVGIPILFDVNSAVIKPESRSALDTISAALQSPTLKDAKIQIEGHTDGTGQAESNQRLSEERADAVRDFLVKTEGVSGDRLTTVGKGQTDPVDPNTPLAPENRRVVLVNLSN